MNKLMRCLIAAPVITILLVADGASMAAISSSSRIFVAEVTLSRAGFLDFKSILFSSASGENLDGVFNQIRFIGPETFENAAQRHGILHKFKSSPGPIWSVKPLWQENDNELEVLNVEILGKPTSASKDLIDAILGDMTDHYRNHGFSGADNPAMGMGTANYFNTASQKVLSLIGQLENSVSGKISAPSAFGNSRPLAPKWNLIPVFFCGLLLLAMGLLWRRFRRKRMERAKTIQPAEIFDIIQRSPIRYVPKAT